MVTWTIRIMSGHWVAVDEFILDLPEGVLPPSYVGEPKGEKTIFPIDGVFERISMNTSALYAHYHKVKEKTS